MLLLYTGLAIVLVVLGTGGEVGRLLDVRLHRVRLLVAGVGIHLLVSHWRPTGGFGRAVGFLLVLASIALVVRFVVANLGLTNMSVVLVGLGLNALCVLVNGGMPVAVGSSATDAQPVPYEHSLTHHVQRGDDHLTVLADHLRLPGPDDTPISYGDLILAFGLIGVGYRLGAERRGAHAARPNAAPVIEVPDDEPLFPDDEPITVLAAPPLAPVVDFLAGVAGASAGPSEHDLGAVAAFVAGADAAAVEAVDVEAQPVTAEPEPVEHVASEEPDAVAEPLDGEAPEPVLAEDEAVFEDEEPIEALLVDFDDEPALAAGEDPWTTPIPPLPEVATDVDEPIDEPVPTAAAAATVPAWTWPDWSVPRLPTWTRRPRRHRRLPRPVRPGRLDLQQLFAPVPLEPEELLLPWWGEPDPTLAETEDDEQFEMVPAGRPGPRPS